MDGSIVGWKLRVATFIRGFKGNEAGSWAGEERGRRVRKNICLFVRPCSARGKQTEKLMTRLSHRSIDPFVTETLGTLGRGTGWKAIADRVTRKLPALSPDMEETMEYEWKATRLPYNLLPSLCNGASYVRNWECSRIFSPRNFTKIIKPDEIILFKQIVDIPGTKAIFQRTITGIFAILPGELFIGIDSANKHAIAGWKLGTTNFG